MNETRGVPFKIISLLLAVMFLLTGLRDIIAPNYALSGTDYEKERLDNILTSLQQTDSVDLWQFYTGLSGLYALTNAALRFQMATTTHVAELYNSMLFIVMLDSGLLLVAFRMGIAKLPIFYAIMMIGALLYESYVLYVARQAHLARLKMKKITDYKDE